MLLMAIREVVSVHSYKMSLARPGSCCYTALCSLDAMCFATRRGKACGPEWGWVSQKKRVTYDIAAERRMVPGGQGYFAVVRFWSDSEGIVCMALLSGVSGL